MEDAPRFADVAVNSGLPHRQAFSYAVPPRMRVDVGYGVYVPFGRRTLQGVVVRVTDAPGYPEVREVSGVIGDGPVVSPERVELALWMANYYLAPLFDAIALTLPPGFERRPLTTVRALVRREELDGLRLPPRQREIVEALLELGEASPERLEKATGQRSVAGPLSLLERRGFVERRYALGRPAVGPKVVTIAALTATPEVALERAEALTRASRRARALRLLAEAGEATAAALREATGIDRQGLAALQREGLISLREERIERDPLAEMRVPFRPPPELTPAQEAVYQEIEESIRFPAPGRPRRFLLHGVTGAGKTEVYLRALQAAVEAGKRGIVLVPEIALTPQTVRRFAERFPGRVAVIHSGLSEGERYDQWHGIRDGRYDVVIGARSALFAPQPDLGLIILDEEHEWTYKQHDPPPRYHAREVAEQLARLTGATLVLGSATPDIVSFHRAQTAHYRLLTLDERVRATPAPDGGVELSTTAALPPITVVDLREELRTGNRSIFSRALQLALRRTLDRGEQAILFLNRRGAAGFLQCRDCGYVPECSSCDIALTYHREADRLVCHLCNRRRRVPERCPVCESARIRMLGVGVERVEEEVRRLFPEARVLRWDRDVTGRRGAHERILAQFLAGEADVLVGTQMLAKGLDFPAVTLVGIVSADVGLHLPDVRASERAFQVLTQVAGRAGRAALDGRVILQTYTPEHPAIEHAARHDYEGFYRHEIELRRRAGYPPFARLVKLTFQHTSATYAFEEARRVERLLRNERDRRGLDIDIRGPA
ncbi:MAG TPA: primosomal protein N', partial [Dehalococcoidia bacterium]|nr:primosomal protein N' [Dehalococcoidia bacterium]